MFTAATAHCASNDYRGRQNGERERKRASERASDGENREYLEVRWNVGGLVVLLVSVKFIVVQFDGLQNGAMQFPIDNDVRGVFTTSGQSSRDSLLPEFPGMSNVGSYCWDCDRVKLLGELKCCLAIGFNAVISEVCER